MVDEENEENTENENSQEVTPKETSTPLIDKSLDAAKAMKEQNDRMEQLIQRQESLMSKDILGGSTEAGREPEKPKEETPEEYTKKVLSGEIEYKDESS